MFRTTGEGGVIKDLNLKDVTISNTGDYVGYGALVGYSNGNLTIENVNVISGSITGYKCVGGLVGETKEGKYATVIIKNCVNNVPVTSKNVDAGGLIGNGASVSASIGGKCVDTSMGLAPLEGVIMGTRSGDLDPAIIEFIADKENLDVQLQVVERRKEELEHLQQQERVKLEAISGLSAEQAKERLVESLKDEAKTDAASYINDIMEEAKMTANKEAKRIVIQTIQRIATETAVEKQGAGIVPYGEVALRIIRRVGEYR